MNDKMAGKIPLWTLWMALAGVFLTFKLGPGATHQERLAVICGFAATGSTLGILFSLRLRNSK